MQTANRQSHASSISVKTPFNGIIMLCNIFVLRFCTITNTPHFDLKMVFIKFEDFPKDAAIAPLKAVRFSDLLGKSKNEIDNLMSACEHYGFFYLNFTSGRCYCPTQQCSKSQIRNVMLFSKSSVPEVLRSHSIE
jgi:hypothetical protein